jgi:formylglycine-generating enzyme required for sulfatase activity
MRRTGIASGAIARWVLLALGASWTCQASDILTLQNGEIYLGRVVLNEYPIAARYGRVVLPKVLVTGLRISKGEATLLTVDGDRISGRLDADRIAIERVAEVPVQVSAADIAEIKLDQPPAMLKMGPSETLPAMVPDAVEMRNGDVLRVRLLTPALSLKTPHAVRQITLRDARAVDVEVLDEGLAARAVMRDGTRVAGIPLEESIQARTRAGQEVSLPARDISTLVTDIPAGGTASSYLAALYVSPENGAKVFRDVLRSGGEGPEMVVIPPGTFRRGDLQGDGDSDELPVREVRIPRPIALSRYAVTFEDYDRFCELTGRPKPDDESWGRARRPVVNVSWYDAVAYADWLSEQTGHRYRLPTNAEWEYAARAGTETRYWWGNKVGEDHADCAGCGSLWDSARTAPVGKFPPNGFGLFDMGGNVWQWVADCCDIDYGRAPTDGSAYVTSEYCDKKVIRGGSWSVVPHELRAANRWRDFTVRPSDDIGFRVARDL